MNYRCYHLNNFYCQQIMAGIQSAHAQHELAMKYMGDTIVKSPYVGAAKADYVEWATNHKTIIVLNGGMQADLEKWVTFMSGAPVNPFAWAAFYEAPEALNGALTNVAIVLPERIYKFARQISNIVANWNGSNALETVLKNDSTHIYISHADTVRNVWKLTTEMYVDDGEVIHEDMYTKFDIDLMSMLSKCSLM